MSETVQSSDVTTRSSRSQTLVKQGERYALIGVWVLLSLVFIVLLPDTFPSVANLSNMLGSQAVLLILTLGLIFPLRAGDLDLSVASVLTLAATIVASLNVNFGWSVWAASAVAIVAGLLVGVTNGFIVTKFDINPLIVTLGTGTLVVGLSAIVSNSRTITGVDPALSNAVLLKPFWGIPIDFYYAVALCFVVWFIFEKTAFGQKLLFVGQNKDVARLNGVAVKKVRFVSLVISGGVAAVAGVVYVGTTGSADPTSGAGFLLPAFAAAFLGSTTIKVGRFNAWGTLVAVYFLVTGITGLQLMGAQTYVQDLFYGGGLVIAVVLSKIVRDRTEKNQIVQQT